MEMVPQFLSLRQQQEPGHSWLPLPAPGAQSPAHVTTQWAGRMRGTTGHPEIAPLVRNQKGNQTESVRGAGGVQRMGTQGAKEKGGDGWLVEVRMCVSICVCV